MSTAKRLAAPLKPASAKATQIMRAAREVFMREGYGAASMEAIARAADVSKATLYSHFTGKEALFGAVVRERCNQLAQTLKTEELDVLDLAEALRRVARDFLALILSNEAVAIYRMVVAEAPQFQELGRVFYETGPLRVKRNLALYLERASVRGALSVPQPWLAAEQFIGMLQSHFHMPRLLGLAGPPSESAREAAIELAVAVLLRGYAPEAG
jgi:AcrR family transcriptional regulator